MSGPLGFIPAWQFSANPKINPMVNPHVTMPAGMYQAGVFSEQPAFGQDLGQSKPLCLACGGPRASQPGVGGLGYVMIDEPDGMPIVTMKRVAGLQGLGIDNPFDSFWWRNRKAVTIAGLGIAGLLVFSFASSIIR
jgi:hypothetical protein